MNKYLFGTVRFANGLIKTLLQRVTNGNKVRICIPAYISPYTEITVERGANAVIGKGLKMRSASKIRVRKGAELVIGKNCGLSGRNWITVRERVVIGDDVIFGPGTMVYDHDHDFTTRDGIKDGKYLTAPVKIGNNVWIGADCIILRGTEIGDNCVVGAGCVLKGKFEKDSLIIQERNTLVKTRKYKVDD